MYCVSHDLPHLSRAKFPSTGYYGGPILFDEANAYDYGKMIGQRYPFFPYILGGDSNRYWYNGWRTLASADKDITSLPLVDYGQVTEAMARGLIDGEATHKVEDYVTFIIYHSAQVWLPQGPASTGSSQSPDADWITMDACQSGHYDKAYIEGRTLVTKGSPEKK
jgi:hypothetical protein